MNSAPNHPITSTKNEAMKRMYKTTNCGMAKMMRKATVRRFCGAVPAYNISTRPLGMAVDALVM